VLWACCRCYGFISLLLAVRLLGDIRLQYFVLALLRHLGRRCELLNQAMLTLAQLRASSSQAAWPVTLDEYPQGWVCGLQRRWHSKCMAVGCAIYAVLLCNVNAVGHQFLCSALQILHCHHWWLDGSGSLMLQEK
jgi:hypothetical protein